MLKLSHCKLTNVILLLVGFVHSLQTQMPKPFCVYYLIQEENQLALNSSYQSIKKSAGYTDCQVSRAEDRCLHFAQFLSHKMMLSDKFTYKTENNTEYVYVNVTMLSDRNHITNRYLLQEKIGTCWNVQIEGGEVPYEVTVFNLPLSAESADLVAAPVIMEHDLHSCNLSENICNVLQTSTLDFFPIPRGKQVKFKIKRNAMDVDNTLYRIELISGNCSITCDGSENPCPISILSNQIINLTTWAGKEIGFNNVTPAYFCARIGSLDNCCVFHTVTVKLEDYNSDDQVVVYNSTSLLPITVIIVVILSFVLLFALKKNIYRVIHVLISPIREQEVEHEQDTNTLIQEPSNLIEEIRSVNEIYLVYVDESSQEFSDLMSSLRRLLQNFAKKVWDPFSEEDREHFNENGPTWVTKILSIPNIRVVVVETEMAIQIQEERSNGISKSLLQPEDPLANVFLTTLKSLMYNAQLYSNSSNVFVVRFNSNITGSLHLSPNRRYYLPEQFGTLIHNISSEMTSFSFQDFERLNFSPVLQEFKERLQNYLH